MAGDEAVKTYFRNVGGKMVQVKGYKREGSGPDTTERTPSNISARIKSMTTEQISMAIINFTKSIRTMGPEERAKAIIFLQALAEERYARIQQRK